MATHIDCDALERGHGAHGRRGVGRVASWEAEDRRTELTPRLARALGNGKRALSLNIPSAPSRRVLNVATMCLMLTYGALCVSLAEADVQARWRPPRTNVDGTVDGGRAATDCGTDGCIPRHIHQMFGTLELPDHWRETPVAWRAHHPGWNYTLWTDASLRELIAAHYPWLLPTYDGYPYDTQRWDASRYALLHRHGGVYADLDLRPSRSIDGLIAGQSALLPRTPNIGLTNAFMASAPGHPFFLHALSQLPRYSRAWYHLSKHNAVLSSTGSTFIWAMAMGWARWHPPLGRPVVIAAADWGKCSICNSLTKPTEQARAGAVSAASATRWTAPLWHVAGNSWHSLDSTLMILLYCRMELLVVAAVAALVWSRWRSPKYAAAAVLCGVGLSQLNGALEVSLAETMLFRPWIWLIMT